MGRSWVLRIGDCLVSINTYVFLRRGELTVVVLQVCFVGTHGLWSDQVHICIYVGTHYDTWITEQQLGNVLTSH